MQRERSPSFHWLPANLHFPKELGDIQGGKEIVKGFYFPCFIHELTSVSPPPPLEQNELLFRAISCRDSGCLCLCFPFPGKSHFRAPLNARLGTEHPDRSELRWMEDQNRRLFFHMGLSSRGLASDVHPKHVGGEGMLCFQSAMESLV